MLNGIPRWDDRVKMHHRWLKKHRQDVDYRGAKDTRLRGYDFSGVSLATTGLQMANLRAADLTDADFRGADLNGFSFHDADLTRANFTDATHLSAEQFAGANLCGCTTLQAAATPDPPDEATDAAKSVTTQFAALFLAGAYSLLTLSTTTDGQLLSNAGEAKLPVVNLAMSIVWFCSVAPAVLVGMYVTFLYTLVRFLEGVTDLPAVYRDGRRLDQRLPNSIFSSLLIAYVPRMAEAGPPLWKVQKWLASFLVWWVVPLVEICFWARYTRRHEWIGTAWHILMVSASITTGYVFYRITLALLRRDEAQVKRWSNLDVSRRTRKPLTTGLVTFFVLLVVSLGLIPGTTIHWLATSLGSGNPGVSAFGTGALYWMTSVPFANLTGTNALANPTSSAESATDLMKTPGASFRTRDMRFARARDALLVNADLRGCSLEGADLRGANLTGAQCQGAGASRIGATSFDGANIAGANLTKANLAYVDLTGAITSEAPRAKGYGALGAPPMAMALAVLAEADLSGLDLRGADLTSADLRHADLRVTDLSHATLGKADLGTADLTEADLTGVDLRQVKNLLWSQLASAKSFDRQRVPSSLKASYDKRLGSMLGVQPGPSVRKPGRTTAHPARPVKGYPVAGHSISKPQRTNSTKPQSP